MCTTRLEDSADLLDGHECSDTRQSKLHTHRQNDQAHEACDDIVDWPGTVHKAGESNG